MSMRSRFATARLLGSHTPSDELEFSWKEALPPEAEPSYRSVNLSQRTVRAGESLVDLLAETSKESDVVVYLAGEHFDPTWHRHRQHWVEHFAVERLRTAELAVVKAGLASGRVDIADARRLTHDSLRRISWGGFLGIATTQFIFLVTGTVILHPGAAAVGTFVCGLFYAMSQSMRRELEAAIKGK